MNRSATKRLNTLKPQHLLGLFVFDFMESSTMPRFTKKPITIEAMQLTEESKNNCLEFVTCKSWLIEGKSCNVNMLAIETLEGVMHADDGDWIIKGVNGEFYPCKPDIFEKTYAPAKADSGLLTFGDAIEAAKAGCKIARKGWNGKGMWVIYNAGSQGQTHAMFDGSVYKVHGVDECEILPHFDMYTVNADGRRAMLAGWLASQTDMVSSDWVIVQCAHV
jgi:hypothetical protein